MSVNEVQEMDEVVAMEKRLVNLGYPATLAKACWDFFSYTIELKNGRVLEFNEAKYVSSKFVKVRNADDERWLEVRVSEIVFCSDAGFKYQSVYSFEGVDTMPIPF